MDKALLVKVEGRVTGVCFRYNTVHQAASCPGIKGYVRNVDYGEVEVLLQGPEAQVDRMIAWLKHGPSMARVDRINLIPVPANPSLVDFVIR